jgi:Cytochrome c
VTLRRVVAGLLSLGLLAPVAWIRAVPVSKPATPLAAGEAIYLDGILGSGAMLEAVRDSGAVGTGSAAACVNCHRHSGLGTTEGTVTIPPVAGAYLFQPRIPGQGEAALTYVSSARANRDPYTDATLARAIREGIDSEGRTLSVLMPRFRLGDSDMVRLIAYLRTLDPQPVPGVTDTTLHFASIITPDADPKARAGMLDVLTHYFADKNAFPFPPTPKMRSSGKTLYAKSMYMANRHWQLHVWELTGPAAGWTAQLKRRLNEEPVLAAVSGLGGAQWAPVHEFCQHERLPCLFPNVEVPVVAEHDFYPLYFSKSVLLEADLIAHELSDWAQQPTGALVQVYRSGDSGEAAARALAAALAGHGLQIRNRALPAASPPSAVSDALQRTAAGDVLVLWLRAEELAALKSAPPPTAAQIFVSGLLGGFDNAPLPDSWRGRVRMTYPLDLPASSQVRVSVPLQWFKIRKIALVAEPVQVNTYLACGFLAETVSHMADTIGREYLVERLEEMMEHRLMTGPYPRLTLGVGQRFASKGGYLVRFAGSDLHELHADGDWVVP